MNISLVTGVLILNDKHEVLLCLKPAGVGPYSDMYLSPGGHLKPDELASVAAVREVMEETGVTTANLQPLIFDEFVTPNYKGNLTHFIALIYTADYISGDLKPSANDDDHMRIINWFNRKQVKNLSLSPPLLRALKKINFI